MRRRRFAEHRLDGLFDDPRVGAPRKISGEAVEAIVVQTLEPTPKSRTNWSTRKMLQHTYVSCSSVGRIGPAHG